MAALAKELGVTQSTLTNILSAARSASPELIRRIEQLAPRIEDGSILGAQALSRGLDIDPLNRLSTLESSSRKPIVSGFWNCSRRKREQARTSGRWSGILIR
jgi:hypothetical protein